MTPTLTQPVIYGTREEWEGSRRDHIGASEVATLIGANPYQSPLALWSEKVGLLPRQDASIAMRRGHIIEPFAAELYEEATNEALRDPGEFAVWSHPELPCLRCTPDRLRVSDGAPVELKDLGYHVARQMAEGDPPLGYIAQVQCQMAVLGASRADLGCVIDGRDFKVFSFGRDDKFIAVMLAEVAEFYERLQTGTPPPPDGLPSTAAALAALHPDDNGETITLPSDAIQAAYALNLAKVRLKELETEKAAAENVLKAALGNATFGEAPGMRWSWKTQERAGCLRVPDTDEARRALDLAGIDFKETATSKFRVLRSLKARV